MRLFKPIFPFKKRAMGRIPNGGNALGNDSWVKCAHKRWNSFTIRSPLLYHKYYYFLEGEKSAVSTTVCRSNYRYMYWTAKQQLAQQTVTGCNIRPGDVLGSGTISGEVSSFISYSNNNLLLSTSTLQVIFQIEHCSIRLIFDFLLGATTIRSPRFRY